MTIDAIQRRLTMADSQNRGSVLLDIINEDPAMSTGRLRALFNENWTICEAWGDRLDEALDLLYDAGWCGDELPDPTAETLTVYRATGGEEPDGGSWTLDLEVAKKFALMIASPRAAFLGFYSKNPIVWEAEIFTSSALAYFTSRGESEVVLPNGVVEPVGILRLGATE